MRTEGQSINLWKIQNLGWRRIEVSEIGFEPRTEEDRSIVFQKNSKPRAKEGQSISSWKVSKPRSEEDRSISESRWVSNLRQKRLEASFFNKSQRLVRKRVKMSFYNSLEPRAEEGRNHSQSRAEEGGNITSNLTRKSEEVTRSSRTLNLVRKRGRASIHRESRTSRGGGREHYFRSHVKKGRSYKISKNPKPCAVEDQSI